MNLDMYRQNILDHSRHPHNFGTLDGEAEHAQAVNPLCGDEVEMFLRFGADNRVEEAKFSGRGCAITVAAASLLTDALHGLTRSEVVALRQEDAVALLQVPIMPARMKCATLSLEALRKITKENTH